MTLSRLIVIAACVAIAASAQDAVALAQHSEEKLPELLWTVDLSSDVGFARHTANAAFLGAQVTFLADSSMAVSFLTTREEAQTEYEAVFIATETGSTYGTLTWPSSDNYARLFPTTAGEFLVSTGSDLYRHSSSLKLLQTIPIATRSKIYVSPDGKLLLLRSFAGPGHFDQSVVKTIDLASRTALDWNGLETHDISDAGETLDLRQNPRGPIRSISDFRLTSTVLICKAANACATIYSDAGMEARFVDNDRLLVQRNKDMRLGWVLVNRSGKVLFEDSFRQAEGIIGQVSRAPSAGEISFQTGYIGRDWVYSVHVFDIDRAKYVHIFEFRKKPAGAIDRGYGDFDQALSPDGSRIAILRGSVLELYRIRNR